MGFIAEVAVSPIGNIDRKYYSGLITVVRGRIIQMNFDIYRHEAHLLVKDRAEEILVKIKNSYSQILTVGASVNIHEVLKLYKNKFFMESLDIFKL